MQTLTPTLTEVVFHFKCFVQSAITVYYGCAHLYIFQVTCLGAIWKGRNSFLISTKFKTFSKLIDNQ